MYNPYDDNQNQNNIYEPSPRTYSPYDIPEPRKQKQPKSVGIGALIAVGLVCSLLGGIIGAGAMSFVVPRLTTSNIYEGDRETTVIDTTRVDTSTQLTAAQVYAANVNSTVGITTTLVTTNFWGYSTTSAASGSGFIYSDDGYILTNYHVVEGASAVTVTTYDGTKYDAVIMGYDQSNDIAVLKVEAEGLVPVILGDSDIVNVGDTVVAIGNPLGELTFSLTSGIISALNREVTFSGGISMDLIQTDCAINSGNSGGALFNMYGEVIGITNAKYSSSSSGEASIDNIGFAIPMNSVRTIVDSIIEKGFITKPYVGISVLTVSDSVISYGLPAGASIQEIVENAPADKAGLEVNDIITSVDGTEVTTSDEVVDIIGDTNPGDVVIFTIYRSGSYMDIEVTIGEQITQMTVQAQSQSSTQSQQGSQWGQGSQGYGGYSNPWGR